MHISFGKSLCVKYGGPPEAFPASRFAPNHLPHKNHHKNAAMALHKVFKCYIGGSFSPKPSEWKDLGNRAIFSFCTSSSQYDQKRFIHRGATKEAIAWWGPIPSLTLFFAWDKIVSAEDSMVWNRYKSNLQRSSPSGDTKTYCSKELRVLQEKSALRSPQSLSCGPILVAMAP